MYLSTIHGPFVPRSIPPRVDADADRWAERPVRPTLVGVPLFFVQRLLGAATPLQPSSWSRPFQAIEVIDDLPALAQFNNLQFWSDIMDFLSDLWDSFDAWDRAFYRDIGPTSHVRYNLWSSRQELVEVWTAVYAQYMRCWKIQHQGSHDVVGLLIEDF